VFVRVHLWRPSVAARQHLHDDGGLAEEHDVKRTQGLARLAAVVAVAAAAAPLYAQGTTLRYRWIKGDALTYRVTILTTSQVSGAPGGGGREMKIDQTMTQVLKIAVSDVAADGTATLSQTFQSVKMEMNSPMGRFVYDTALPTTNTNPMAQAMGQVLGAMAGETITVVQAPDGSVKRVEGASRILDKVVKSLPSDPASSAMAQGLKASLSDEALKATLEQSFTRLPDRAVQSGDTWHGQLNLGNDTIGKIAGSVDFTLKGVEGTGDAVNARISVIMTMKQESALPAGPNGMMMKLGDAKGEGEMLFDVAKGRIRKSTMKSTMPSTISGQAQDGTPLTVANLTTTSMTMELVEK
jgi:uncharacterized protein DUF6263